ncbi:hypothetical protein YC2023_108890 [Brassica napus]
MNNLLLWTVGSRAWETSRGISLIPFADFMNHDGLSASIVLTDEDNQLSEVLIRYGEFSNATLMLDFGFTLPYNTHDEGSEISYRERNSSVSPSILHVFSLVPLLKLNDLSKEAEQNDGRLARLPFKDRSRELEAHKIILAHINSLIVDHSVCIKVLQNFDSINCHIMN